MKPIYMFNGEDITMSVVLQTRAVVDIIKKERNINFVQALEQFYDSNTSQVMRDVENGLWAESPAYIADCFFENRF